MAIAFVTAATGNQSGPAASHNSSSFDTSTANFIAVGIACSGLVSSVTDNKGNTYTLIGPYATSTDNVYIAYKANASVGTGTIITVNAAAGSFFAVCPACYSGLATVTPFDKEMHGAGNSAALNSGATATTTQANELVLCTGTLSSGSDLGFGASGSFTMRSSENFASTGGVCFLEDQIVSATGAQTGVATSGGNTGLWTCLVATFADTTIGGGGATITPSAGTLAFTGVAPSRTTQITITPVKGALAFSGNAPTVASTGAITPQAGVLAFIGNAPSVTQQLFRTPIAGVLAFTGIAPVVSSGGNITITPSAGSLSFTGVASPQELGVPSPVTGDLALTGYAPAVSLGIVRVPNAGSLAATGIAPTTIFGFMRVPTAGALAFTGIAPTVTNPGGGGNPNPTITPNTGTLALVAVAPLATQQFYITPNAGALALSGSLVALNGNTIITPLAGVLTVSGATPGVTWQVYIAASAGQLAFAGYAPQVSQALGNPTTITPSTGLLSLTGYPWVFPVLEGALPTFFLGAGVPVPAGASFIGGAAFKSTTGERYVAAWPADNNVIFLGGFAHRPDGALIIDPSGTVAHRLIGVAMTFRGETVTTVAARELVHSGRSLLQSGKLCVTNQG